MQHKLPKGIWLSFDFEDSHPVLFLLDFLSTSPSYIEFSINQYLQHFYIFRSLAKQDLPALYLKGGSIIPVGPAYQHVNEANPTDDLTLLVALDEHGNLLLNIHPVVLLIRPVTITNCLITPSTVKETLWLDWPYFTLLGNISFRNSFFPALANFTGAHYVIQLLI